MKQATDIDLETRHLMKALEPTLRRHLGNEGLKHQFVAGLYKRLRESLEEFEEYDSTASSQREANFQRLALDVYLTAATHLEGREVTPALLSSVRKEIELALSAPGPSPRSKDP